MVKYPLGFFLPFSSFVSLIYIRQKCFGLPFFPPYRICTIPAKYYDQMRKLKPELLAENVNAWFADREQSYMIRSIGC